MEALSYQPDRKGTRIQDKQALPIGFGGKLSVPEGALSESGSDVKKRHYIQEALQTESVLTPRPQIWKACG